MKSVNELNCKLGLLAPAVLAVGLLAGCGGGGSSLPVQSNASAGPVGDAVPISKAGTTGASAAGCTNASFAPTFASIVPLYRWTHEPIRVRFANSGVVTGSDGSQSDLQQIALEGFQEWSTATNSGIVVQITTDPAQTDVTVRFGYLAAVPTANDVLGLETSTLFADNTIKSTDVMLNTWPGMTGGNIESFRETAAHEFGHALGIDGHSDSSSDVMYRAHVLTSGKALSARDVNTLRTAYCNAFTREAPAHPVGPERTVSIQ